MAQDLKKLERAAQIRLERLESLLTRLAETSNALDRIQSAAYGATATLKWKLDESISQATRAATLLGTMTDELTRSVSALQRANKRTLRTKRASRPLTKVKHS